MYNDTAWASNVQGIVSKYRILGGSVGLIGHKKDDSSFYLSMFPQWELVDVGLFEQLNATNIRDLYFRENVNMKFIHNVVPPSTFRMLEGRIGTPSWKLIIEERVFVEKYKQQYAALPYPPIFSTGDAVVFCSGHVLLVKRRAVPGKGLWAVPGGYVNANTDKSVVDAALRELREETKISVPLPVLRGSIVDTKVFDAIDRSPRGRIITHVVKIVIPLVDGKLPKIKGSDDAKKAKWVPIGEVNRAEMFEDHFEIILWAVNNGE
jgi:bifunctional NMN adenylyltransferase/nudix hydrolase